MSYLRFQLDLAVKEPLPDALSAALPDIRAAILKLKSYASRVNEGTDNEEMTARAVWHRCKHDEGAPCEPEREV